MGIGSLLSDISCDGDIYCVCVSHDQYSPSLGCLVGCCIKFDRLGCTDWYCVFRERDRVYAAVLFLKLVHNSHNTTF